MTITPFAALPALAQTPQQLVTPVPAAVGVPDSKSGEAVKLFVVKKDPALTAADVLKHCREHLTGYKCPRDVEFRTDLPKTNVGKILRRELRDEMKKAAA